MNRLIKFSLAIQIAFYSSVLAMAQAFAVSPNIPKPYEFGTFKVGKTEIQVVDPSTDSNRLWNGVNLRPIEIDVWYPRNPISTGNIVEYKAYPYDIKMVSRFGAIQDAPGSNLGPFPVVIFSHGSGTGTELIHAVFFETLASHGFVVAAISHTGNTSGDSVSDRFGLNCPLADMGQTRPCTSDDNFVNSNNYNKNDINRVLDVTLTIDTLLAQNSDPTKILYKMINGKKIGMAGYSRGIQTALLTSAGFAPYNLQKEPRVKSLFLIDGSLIADRVSLTPTVDVPTLLIAGSPGTEALGQLPPGYVTGVAGNQLLFEQLTVSPRTYVKVRSTGHIAFFEVCPFQQAAGIQAQLDGLTNPFAFSIPNLFISPDTFISVILPVYPNFIGVAKLCREKSSPSDDPMGVVDNPYWVYTPTSPEQTSPAVVNHLLRLYGVSFFKVYLENDRRYEPFLTPGYAKENEPFVDSVQVKGGKSGS